MSLSGTGSKYGLLRTYTPALPWFILASFHILGAALHLIRQTSWKKKLLQNAPGSITLIYSYCLVFYSIVVTMASRMKQPQGRGISSIFSCCFKGSEQPDITYCHDNPNNAAVLEPTLPMPPLPELDSLFTELVVSRRSQHWVFYSMCIQTSVIHPSLLSPVPGWTGPHSWKQSCHVFFASTDKMADLLWQETGKKLLLPINQSVLEMMGIMSLWQLLSRR